MKTHAQLVQEWKEKLQEQIRLFFKEQTLANVEEWNREIAPYLVKFDKILVSGMLAAAKGAAEAGRVEEKALDQYIAPDSPSEYKIAGFNIAISQSAAQLQAYFKDIV